MTESKTRDRNLRLDTPARPEAADASESRRGRCYELSGSYLLAHGDSDPTLRLVHGWPVMQSGGEHAGLRYGHAWVERVRSLPVPVNGGEGFAMIEFRESWDSVSRQWFPTALWRSIGRIDPDQCRTYDLSDLCSLAVDSGHWGPWTPNPYPADESAPAER